MRQTLWIVWLGVLLSLAGCIGMPDDVEPVADFEAKRYLGRWYEIARLDHSFERGLESVNATYSLRDDGGLRVVNRGYDTEDGEWREAVGKAYFVEDDSVAHIKVSFFGPFYGSYVVFDLDKRDYSTAFVSGYNHSYLWLLARSTSVSEAVKTDFLRQAEALGFATEDLVWVDQSRSADPQ
ncbi:MAG: lipocalin family protein [Chromatocurvus sp.]